MNDFVIGDQFFKTTVFFCLTVDQMAQVSFGRSFLLQTTENCRLRNSLISHRIHSKSYSESYSLSPGLQPIFPTIGTYDETFERVVIHLQTPFVDDTRHTLYAAHILIIILFLYPASYHVYSFHFPPFKLSFRLEINSVKKIHGLVSCVAANLL